MNKYTQSAQDAIDIATEVARGLSHNYIGTEHLLIGLIVAEGTASKVLAENGVDEERVIGLISKLITDSDQMTKTNKDNMTPRAEKLLKASAKEALRLNSQSIGTEHILVAIIKDTTCLAVRLLTTLGVNLQKLYIDTLTASGFDMNFAKNDYMAIKGKGKSKSVTPTLDQYSRDLTALAKEGKLDPCIGRNKEIERVIQILSRRS